VDFYLDHDVAIELADDLRALGHQALTTRDQGAETARDFRQLLIAAQAHRVLVTHNRKDFRLLHGAWITWSEVWGVQAIHAGILILPHARPAESARRLQAFAQNHPGLLSNELHECNGRGEWIRRL
jgi:hypothetical protein